MALSALGITGPFITSILSPLPALRTRFKTHQDTLIIISSIEEGDKLSKEPSGGFYISKSSWFQKVSRYWYSQNRENTAKDLEGAFSDFLTLLTDIRDNRITSMSGEYGKFVEEVALFVKGTIQGLYNLKTTYKGKEENEEEQDDATKKIIARIDSIILSLIDFRDAVTASIVTRNHHMDRIRSRSFD